MKEPLLLTPAGEAAAAAVVREYAARRARLRIVGGGTREPPGGCAAVPRLSSRALTGITHYESDDLIVTARAGTPLAEVEDALARNGQRLAFEPPDHRRFFGTCGTPTIGAAAAADLSGPRRLAFGSARDHLVGVRLVNGRGETVRCGGRTLKNVAGLDLPKLLAGSAGSLGFITEVGFRVQAVPEAELTLAFRCDPVEMLPLFARARSAGVRSTGGAYLCARSLQAAGLGPWALSGGTAFARFEGRVAAVREHAERFEALLGAGALRLPQAQSPQPWLAIRDLHAFADDPAAPVRRLRLPEGDAAGTLRALASHLVDRLQIDVGGQQAWMATDDAGGCDRLAASGLLAARLVPVRLGVPSPTPASPAATARLALLRRSVKNGFDPGDVFAAAAQEHA